MPISCLSPRRGWRRQAWDIISSLGVNGLARRSSQLLFLKVWEQGKRCAGARASCCSEQMSLSWKWSQTMNCSCGAERCAGKLSIHCAHSLTRECTDACLFYSSTWLRNEPHMKALNEPLADPVQSVSWDREERGKSLGTFHCTEKTLSPDPLLL